MENAMVTSTQLDDFTRKVTDMRKQGWLPQGGITTGVRPDRGGGNYYYMQAMTKGMKF